MRQYFDTLFKVEEQALAIEEPRMKKFYRGKPTKRMARLMRQLQGVNAKVDW